MTGFDVGLRTSGPTRVASEPVIDVEDLVVPFGKDLDTVDPPRTRLVPPVPPRDRVTRRSAGQGDLKPAAATDQHLSVAPLGREAVAVTEAAPVVPGRLSWTIA